MGRAPRCSKAGLNRGAWTAEKDDILCKYIYAHGEGNWRSLPANAGLKRCGKSCRLRWVNYHKPNIKRGNFTEEEDDLIIRLHNLLCNRWSLIGGRLPGRTDNEVKNYWNTHMGKIRQTDSNAEMKTQKMCRPKPRKRRTQITLPMSHSRQATSALQLNPTETNASRKAGSKKKRMQKRIFWMWKVYFHILIFRIYCYFFVFPIVLYWVRISDRKHLCSINKWLMYYFKGME